MSIFLYIIYIQVVWEKYIVVSKQLEICIYCSMNKQYVEGVQKWKKFQLLMMDSKMVIAMLVLQFNDRTGDNVFTIQRTEAKEGENVLGGNCQVTYLMDMPTLPGGNHELTFY